MIFKRTFAFFRGCSKSPRKRRTAPFVCPIDVYLTSGYYMARKCSSGTNSACQANIEVSTQTIVPEFAVGSIARCLLPHLRKFYEDPQNQAEYEEWKGICPAIP